MSIQLYGFWRSNAAFRVRVALALKNLAFDEIEVDILSGRQFDPDYDQINAEHLVPTLVHDGHRVFQSLAIIEYLDDQFPAVPLLPAQSKDRAHARALALVSAADSHPLVVPRVRKYLATTFGADAEAIETWCRQWVVEGLLAYQQLLERRPPAPYALGDSVSVADIGIAGQIVMADLYQVDMAAFPRVQQLGQRCFELAAFAQSHPFQQPGYPGTSRP